MKFINRKQVTKALVVRCFLLMLASLSTLANAENNTDMNANNLVTKPLKSVSLTHENIRYLGAQYIDHQPGQVSFTRHSKAVLALPKKQSQFNAEKAQTTSGITITFATDSDDIDLNFAILPTINRGAEFAIYENNRFYKAFKFSNKLSNKNTQLQLAFSSQNAGKKSQYKVVLPSLANVALQSLNIQADSQLLPFNSDRKKKYVALGDSITHGVGQGSASYLTYPFLLAQALDLELYNLAVGGAQVSIPTADMLAEFENVDTISLLIGYNDWNNPNADLDVFKARYNQMIDSILTAQPNSKLYCITPLYTKREKAKFSPLPIQAYRDAMADIIVSKQKVHDNLFLIHGEKISSVANLRTDNLNDPVHLGIDGAKLLAHSLAGLIH